MSRTPPVIEEFAGADDPVVLDALSTQRRNGRGWTNIEPVIDAEYEPPAPGLFAFLGGSTHHVPTATVLAGAAHRGGFKPTTVGIEHATGPRVVARLRGLGIAVPDGWRVLQDHPRRGLVLGAPFDTPVGPLLAWVLTASSALCQVEATGRWRATIFDSEAP